MGKIDFELVQDFVSAQYGEMVYSFNESHGIITALFRLNQHEFALDFSENSVFVNGKLDLHLSKKWLMFLKDNNVVFFNNGFKL